MSGYCDYVPVDKNMITIDEIIIDAESSEKVEPSRFTAIESKGWIWDYCAIGSAALEKVESNDKHFKYRTGG